MKKKAWYALWGGLFVICAGLSLVPEPGQGLRWIMRILSVLFFVPPAVLVWQAAGKKDSNTLALVRNLSGVSLALTVVTLVLNLLSVLRSETLGDMLHVVLAIVSTPMICSGYWVLSLFLLNYVKGNGHMVSPGIPAVQGILHKLPDLLFLPPELHGQRNIEDQIHMLFSLNHPEIMEGQPGVFLPQQPAAGFLQPVQHRIVGNDGIIVDHKVNSQAAQAFPFHVIDPFMAFQRVLPVIHFHMEGSEALPGTIVMDQKIVIPQDLRVRGNIIDDRLPQFWIRPFAQQGGDGVPGQGCAAV